MSHPFQKELQELQRFIDLGDQKDQSISKVSTFWHIDHSLKVIQGIIHELHDSQPEDYHPKRSIAKWMIMTTGWIPRGKGRAPKFTIPQEIKSQPALQERLESIKEASKGLEELPSQSHFRHPLFGSMKLKQTLKFTKIHTRHHLKIIKEIVK